MTFHGTFELALVDDLFRSRFHTLGLFLRERILLLDFTTLGAGSARFNHECDQGTRTPRVAYFLRCRFRIPVELCGTMQGCYD